MKLRWTLQALADLEQIEARATEFGSDATRRMGQEIIRSIELIKDFPLSSPIMIEPNIRGRLLRRSRYIIFYRFVEPDIQILNLRRWRPT